MRVFVVRAGCRLRGLAGGGDMADTAASKPPSTSRDSCTTFCLPSVHFSCACFAAFVLLPLA